MGNLFTLLPGNLACTKNAVYYYGCYSTLQFKQDTYKSINQKHQYGNDRRLVEDFSFDNKFGTITSGGIKTLPLPYRIGCIGYKR